MISLQKKFIFVHVPKTGGNSIQNILRNYSEDQIVCKGGVQDGVERFGVVNRVYKTVKHSPLSQYKQTLPQYLYADMYKFAAVRNPWDMLVSLYFSPVWNRTSWDRRLFETLIDKTPVLRDFIVTDDSRMKPIDADVDFIVRFENLEEDFLQVCGLIGIPAQRLPHRNRSQRKHYSCYYDSCLRKKVAEKFAEEISVFGYSFCPQPGADLYGEELGECCGF